ncbi:peroxisomal membrane protein PEX13 isoform X1 [Vespula maculifrons]|uniref:Peroxisomal membrane protein PEX13 n=1 Tax=Vespula maculifrons TaxID=7453 RepID=A0ABD2AWB1_VESMC
MAPERSNMSTTNQLRNASSVFTSTSGIQSNFNAYNAPATGVPPPLPPRQSMGYNEYRPGYLNSYGGYGSMNNYYRGYNSYGSFGGYTGYSNNSNYNNYGFVGGPSGDIESRFTQYAEDSTRSTFQMLETVLQTFSSVTMLLESTYFAITNCFKAILSVADSVGRLRSTISQLLSTFALIRFLKWIYRKITYTIGLRKGNLAEEELWQKSLIEAVREEKSSSSLWSNFLFLGIFVIIPYLIHKISSNVKELKVKCTDPKEWTNLKEPVYAANALYDFTATCSDELNMKAGQKIWLAPQPLQPKNIPGWWIATDSKNVGLIPSNYVTIVAQLKKRPEVKPSENSTPNVSTQNANELQQDSLLDNGHNNYKSNNQNVELHETCDKESQKIEFPETSNKTDYCEKQLA